MIDTQAYRDIIYLTRIFNVDHIRILNKNIYILIKYISITYTTIASKHK